jgi:hypothetical protein
VSSLFNDVLNNRANLDQTGRAFLQDAYESMLDQGTIALFPTDYDDEPEDGEISTVDILAIRVAEIIGWGAQKVRIKAWDENTGKMTEVDTYKTQTFIVQNPFYSIMNEPNAVASSCI